MTPSRLIVSRTFIALLTLCLVSITVFLMIDVLPGDVASRILGREATAESVAQLRAQLHLDDPLVIRYLHWIGNILSGELGKSLASGRPVAEIIAPRIRNTLFLSLGALIVYVPLLTLTAIVQATHRNRFVDHLLSGITLLALSIPDFLLGTLLLVLFVLVVPILPAVSYVDASTPPGRYVLALVMPAVTLGIVITVHTVRMLRDNLIEVLDSDYVRMAELKGLRRSKVLFSHALPNALIPTLNIVALNLVYLIGGVVIVEKVFAFPGFGSLLVDSIQLRDYPMIEATVLIAASVYIVANLAADVATVLLNPRLRRAA
jgi:peptide/nickel transport system permease protein